jgi:hypothetical protein
MDCWKGKSGGERWQINKGTGQGCGAERSTQAENVRLFNQSWRFGSKSAKQLIFEHEIWSRNQMRERC